MAKHATLELHYIPGCVAAAAGPIAAPRGRGRALHQPGLRYELKVQQQVQAREGRGGPACLDTGFWQIGSRVISVQSRTLTPALAMAAPLVVVFDWDCTITSRHMFKTLAGWEGYGDELSNFCAKRDITDPLSLPMEISICERMQFGGGTEGDALLRTVFIEFFMGGQKRAAGIKELLTTLRSEGATLCILTRGETHSLHVLFDTVLEDWGALFEGGWIGNTLNDFFTIEPDGSLSSVSTGLSAITGECTKQQLLESVFPFTKYLVLLVDDDISPETDKVLASSAPGARGGSISQLDLPLEKDGLQPTSISLLLSLVRSLNARKSVASMVESDGLNRSLPAEQPIAQAGPATMMPQQQRGFAALQALVQRGGLEEMRKLTFALPSIVVLFENSKPNLGQEIVAAG